MKKNSLGDIFFVETSNGYALLQYLFEDHRIGSLIRVFEGFFEDVNKIDFNQILIKKFDLFFPLEFMLKKKMIGRVDGINLRIDAFPLKMKEPFIVRGEFKGWYIINIDDWKRELSIDLSNEEKEYSEWGIWNFQLLLERLETNWTPKQEVHKVELEYLGKGK